LSLLFSFFLSVSVLISQNKWFMVNYDFGVTANECVLTLWF